MPSQAQRRKPGKKAQDGSVAGSKSAGSSSKPAPPASAKTARKAVSATPAAAGRPTEAPPGLQAAGVLVALVLLLFAHHAAVRLLAPQTGEWLASSFCSLALCALAIAAAVLGHAAVEADALLPGAGGSGAPPGGIIPAAWWAAAGAALVVAFLRPEQLAGSLLLAPGLAGGSGRRISDAQLTLGAMGTAAAAFGPLFAALGCAAGACSSRVMRRLAPGSRTRPAVLLLVASAAAASLWLELPAALVPARPGSTLPPALAAAAAGMAAVLAPRQAGSSGSRPAVTAAGAVAVAAALVAAGLRQPCTAVNRPLQGGRYSVLWRCEMEGGGQLSVVEGTLREQYRYRLLRLDHSIMGGEYVAPPEVAGQSVYSAFYLQQAAALLRPNGTRSLHVGLGIGTAVKAMQRLGVAADAVELHPEVLAAARRYFGLQPSLHGGRALVGDAGRLVPRLAAEAGQRYDYVLHDVFSGGGIAPPLMDRAFFRQLRSVLTPGGVLAVNYFGGRGAGLKQAWCRLRLEFRSVRAFSDVEKSRLRNHVLFASDADLAAVNLTAGLAAMEARAAAMQAAAASGPSSSSGAGGSPEQPAEQALEVLDPLQLQVWRALPRQEVHLTYDRLRCEQLLELDGAPTGRSSGGGGGSSGGGGSGSGGTSREDSEQQQPSLVEQAAGKAARKAPLGKLGQAQRQRQQAQQAAQRQPVARPPWVWRKMKQVRERHAVAVGHWVAMRTGWPDAFWLD